MLTMQMMARYARQPLCLTLSSFGSHGAVLHGFWPTADRHIHHRFYSDTIITTVHTTTTLPAEADYY